MPRSPRYNSPGAIHHIMLRGNQGRPIFYSDDDRVHCCLLIQEAIERYGHRIHGFCLMSNHIHLAWQQGLDGISAAIQNIAFRYAQRVNYFRNEVGHVFQGRFKSILVNKEDYLTQLVRYIHLNPVRAGLVKRPEDYKWSGHNAYLGFDPVTWVECDYVLQRYSEDRESAVKRYTEFVYAGIGVEPEIDFKMGMQSGIIGDDTFIKTVLDKKKMFENECNNLNITVIDLIEHVCTSYGVTKIEVSSESRMREWAHIRAIIALLARDNGLPLIKVAKELKRDPGGLSRLAIQLEKKSKVSATLQQEITTVKNNLRAANTQKLLK